MRVPPTRGVRRQPGVHLPQVEVQALRRVVPVLRVQPIRKAAEKRHFLRPATRRQPGPARLTSMGLAGSTSSSCLQTTMPTRPLPSYLLGITGVELRQACSADTGEPFTV